MDAVEREELRAKELDYARHGGIATIALSGLTVIVLGLGRAFGFIVLPMIVPIMALAILLYGVVVYSLARRSIYSPLLSYSVTTAATLGLTLGLGFISSAIRQPFFLIYVYIIAHPARCLGLRNGLYAMILTNAAYLVMLLVTQGPNPESQWGLELSRLAFLDVIGAMLIMDSEKMLRRMRQLRGVMRKVEQGDYTVRTGDTEKDELGFSSLTLNRMVETQAKLIRTIAETAHGLNDMSTQIAATAGELANSVSEIVRTTQQVTAGTNEQFTQLDKAINAGKSLGSISFDVVNNIKNVEEFSVGVADSAQNALKQSDVIVANISGIGTRYEYLVGLVSNLQNTSVAINKIVETINAISEKINILSLNASIEAARAGEFGRGFSIVADEIKRLADNTQQSATEIGTIINEMSGSVRTVAESGEEVKRAIEGGSVEIRSTTELLNSISSKVIELNSAIADMKQRVSTQEKEVTGLIAQVESSFGISKENASAAEEILASLEEQSAATEQFSATSEELVGVANRLADLVKQFKV